jgi:hypothetical protein
MVSTSAPLTLSQYRSAIKQFSRRGPIKYRIVYWLGFVVPVIGALLVAWAVWSSYVSYWDSSVMESNIISFLAGLFLMYFPVRRSGNLLNYYKENFDGTSYMRELSETGIHLSLGNKFDAQIAWSFYKGSVETPDFFLLFKPLPLQLVIIPKLDLTQAQQAEARAILINNFAPAS